MASGRWRSSSSATPSKMSFSREGSGSRGRVRTTPHSSRETRPDPSPRTTPYPVVAVPGSIPRTITPGSGAGHVGHVDVEVRPDLLHVVEILELLQKPEQRLGVLAGDVHGVLRDH